LSPFLKIVSATVSLPLLFAWHVHSPSFARQ
jgi:hypothetical protein